MAVPVAIVVAAAQNGVIGADNRLLWRLKTDLRRFRDLTMGKPLVMGRKTFDSIGKPLPGRHTIVCTRDAALRIEGASVATSLEAALAQAQAIAEKVGAGEIIVGGGADIYRQALPRADRIHLTLVETAPEGDATFDRIDRTAFREVHRVAHPASPDDEHAFAFIDFVKA